MPIFSVPGAIIGSSLIGGGASIFSGLLGSGAAKQASQIQADAERQALAAQQGIFNSVSGTLQPYISGGLGDIASARTSLSALSPYEATGTNALRTINTLYGNGGNGQAGGTGTPDWSSFFNSPDYQFAYQQGLAATNNALNASGQGSGGAGPTSMLSGGGLTALTQYGQGMASQQFGNYFNRLMQLANTGLTAGTAQASGFAGLGGLGAGVAGSLAGFGGSMANTIGSTIGGIGQAQASGVVGSTNAITGAATGIANAANSGVNNYLGYNMLGALMNRTGSPFPPTGSAYSTPSMPPPSMPSWLPGAQVTNNT